MRPFGSKTELLKFVSMALTVPVKQRESTGILLYYPGITVPRNVVDSIQAINGQNADKIIGLTLFVCF